MSEPVTSNTEVVYYAARLAGEFPSALAALTSVGYSREQAEVQIKNADI
jgi:hypothetical protein